MAMTHVQIHNRERSRPSRPAHVGYDPKIIDSQKIPCTVICRRYDERLIGR